MFLLLSCEKKNMKKISEDFVSEDSVSLKSKSDPVLFKKDFSSVDAIRRQYNLVNSLLVTKKLDSVTFEYECNETSGNVTYYIQNGILKLIKHFEADSHFSSAVNYFVNDGKPYFIFTDETVWSFDGGTPEKPETKDEVTEQRFYIIDNESVKCLEKKYTLKSNSSSNPKPENIPNKEMKSCSIADLQKTFDLLMKNKDRKGKIGCL